MKRVIIFSLVFILSVTLFSGCKKDDDVITTTQATTESSTTKPGETTTLREVITLPPTTTVAITDENGNVTVPETTFNQKNQISEGYEYFTKDQVAKYISMYKKLPSNYLTFMEFNMYASKLGSVEETLKTYAIGGDEFKNEQKLLPLARRRKYYTCDINTQNKKDRGVERLVYSNDGLVFYTNDEYKTLTQLY